MNAVIDEKTMRVRDALRGVASSTDEGSNGSWSLRLPYAQGASISAALQDDWVVVSAPLGRRRGASRPRRLAPASPVACAVRNGELAGGLKYALMPGSSGSLVLTLRTEIPVVDGVDLPARLRDVTEGFRSLGRRSRSDSAGAMAPDAAVGGEDRLSFSGVGNATGAAALEAIARATVWAFTERSAGRLAFDLDIPGAMNAAIVETLRGGGVRASAELGCLEALSGVSTEAIAVLLLRLSGSLRGARGALEIDGACTTARVETSFSCLPSAAELDLSLAALSVGYRMSAEVIQLFADEFLARRYLSVSRWSGVR